MTELEDALAAAVEFDRTETGFSVSTATFDAVCVPGSETVDVTVELPTLDAVVTDEDVAAVVEDGWFETLHRRLTGVTGVTPAEVTSPTVEQVAELVVVDVSVTPRPDHVPGDVLAVVNFIEGTWMGGIIPGYEYTDRIQSIRAEAAKQGGSDDPTPPSG